MEQKGELVSYRPDIKVVDCTLRDGGLVNNFEFSEDFVRDLYKPMWQQVLTIWNSVTRHQRKSLTWMIMASGSSAMRRISGK